MANDKICKISGCGKSVKAKGMCSAHYSRMMKTGDPLSGGEIVSHGDVVAWLKSHVSHTGHDCLISPYGRQTNGYACVRLGGRSHVASRVMCQMAHGDPQDQKMMALHSCGNGHLGCVNPMHLRWGTQSENMMDATKHGTSSRKLSHDDVRAIRSDERSIRTISGDYGVSDVAVQRIKSGKMWGNLE